jgi:ornithine--oxo-acid transaminase
MTLTPVRDRRSSEELICAEETALAHNYHPLPVVVARAEGVWVEDVEGRRYLDMLAGYSALNFGHRHPGLVAAGVRHLILSLPAPYDLAVLRTYAKEVVPAFRE